MRWERYYRYGALCHDMQTLSALVALNEENPLVSHGFPSKESVMKSFDFYFVSLNMLLSKQSIWSWFDVWHLCDITAMVNIVAADILAP